MPAPAGRAGLGERARARLRERRARPVHPVRQRARPHRRRRRAWSISPAISRTICSPASRSCSSYDLGNGLTIERGGELVEKWGGANLQGAAARAAAGDPVHQPLPALSRQPARARPRGAGERRGDPARRRSTSCPPTAPATSTAASPACCATGRRKRRSATCPSPAS